MAEAGYLNGFKTRLDYDAHADQRYAELAGALWRAIGVEVEIHTSGRRDLIWINQVYSLTSSSNSIRSEWE